MGGPATLLGVAGNHLLAQLPKVSTLEKAQEEPDLAKTAAEKFSAAGGFSDHHSMAATIDVGESYHPELYPFLI